MKGVHGQVRVPVSTRGKRGGVHDACSNACKCPNQKLNRGQIGPHRARSAHRQRRIYPWADHWVRVSPHLFDAFVLQPSHLFDIMFAVTSARSSVIARSSGGKVDIKKQGLNSVKNDTVRKNLMGVSDKMADKNWVDSSGRKGA